MLLFSKGWLILLSDGSTIIHMIHWGKKLRIWNKDAISFLSRVPSPYSHLSVCIRFLHTNRAKLPLPQLRGAKLKYCLVETLKGTLDLFLMLHFLKDEPFCNFIKHLRDCLNFYEQEANHTSSQVHLLVHNILNVMHNTGTFRIYYLVNTISHPQPQPLKHILL